MNVPVFPCTSSASCGGRSPPSADLDELAAAIRACRACRDHPRITTLPHEPRPILRVSPTARLLVASQAPGIRAHTSGLPFDDASGERLRFWLGLDAATFHDARRIAIVPMGFCFPGHDALKGDLPPRQECRRLWHEQLFPALPQVETIVAIGLHAIRYHLARLRIDPGRRNSLTEIVANWRVSFDRPAPRLLPLPHPSWRNSAWLKRHPWFEADIVPALRIEVARLA